MDGVPRRRTARWATAWQARTVRIGPDRLGGVWTGRHGVAGEDGRGKLRHGGDRRGRSGLAWLERLGKDS
jgi:hypothetical protein